MASPGLSAHPACLRAGLMSLVTASSANAQSVNTIAYLDGTNGSGPSRVRFDSAGHIYGTTGEGPFSSSLGTVDTIGPTAALPEPSPLILAGLGALVLASGEGVA